MKMFFGGVLYIVSLRSLIEFQYDFIGNTILAIGILVGLCLIVEYMIEKNK